MKGLSRPTGYGLDAAVFAAGLSDVQQAWLHGRWLHPPLPGEVRRQLFIQGGQALPQPPNEPAQKIAVGPETVRVWVQGSQVWLGADLWLDVADPARVNLQVSSQASSEAAWWLALAEAHRVAGWLPLHAALVAGDSGAAIAISGVSGAGKSTAALRFLNAGYRLLAEDQSWIRGQDALATGLDRCLRAFPDSVARFAPARLAPATEKDLHGKLMLPVIRPGQAGLLRQVLVLSGPGPAPLGRAAQVRALWEASGVPLTAAGRRAAAQAASQLLRQAPVVGASRDTVLAQGAVLLQGTVSSQVGPRPGAGPSAG